jgi:lipopolysaccharide/colanic/teichoic acid biosynthesis glycosyltransferase
MRALLMLLLDLGAIAAAAVGSVFLRDNLEFSPERMVALLPYLSFSIGAGALLLPIVGTNRGFWRYSTFGDFLRVGIGASLTVLAATSATFAYDRLDGLARAIPVLHVILAVALMCASRAAMRLRHGLRSRAQITSTLDAPVRSEVVLVLGLNVVAELFLRAVKQFSSDSIHVAGVLGRNDRHRGRFLHGVSILGLPDDLSAVLRRLEIHGVEINRIVVTVAPSELSPAVRETLTAIEDSSSIVIDYFAERLTFDASKAQSHSASSEEKAGSGSAPQGPLPSLREIVDDGLLTRPYWRLKRASDFFLAFVMIIATAPLMAIVAAAVAMDVGVPVLFWQERPGVLGRPIRLYKFRSMRSAHDENGKRIAEASRSSIVGRFLRRTRLDELPQLFNILIGEMSFIGPRPLLPVDQSPAHSARLAVRPGLTGWAQVHGGREVGASDKAAMDLWYICNASLWNDLIISLKTVRMVIAGETVDAGKIEQAWQEIGARVGSDPSSSSPVLRAVVSARVVA